MHIQRPSPRAQADAHVLDARTLGRPVHLLHKFVGPLRDDLAEVFRTGLNRRYRASFELGEVNISRLESVPPRCRWLQYADTTGRIGFAIERQVLLCVLDYRYGARDGGGVAQAAPVPETATEERLAAMLGRQFVSALAERIEWLPEGASGETCVHEFAETAGAPPQVGTWCVRAEVAEPTRGIEGCLWFTLDEAWMQRLLSRLAPLRVSSSRTAATPLASRLSLTLVGRLLEKELPLSVLLDARVGDVIPVSLGATDVLVDDARLFTARVAEHKGKLCLTAFEDVE
jgi:flagellar motor switch protein FliM